MPKELVKHFLKIDWSKIKNVELLSKEEEKKATDWAKDIFSDETGEEKAPE